MQTFWHVTPLTNLGSIQLNGLVPDIGPRSMVIGEDSPAVYFFDDLAALEFAVEHWLGDEFENQNIGNIALLKLSVPIGAHVGFDGLSHYSMETVKPGLIEFVRTEIV